MFVVYIIAIVFVAYFFLCLFAFLWRLPSKWVPLYGQFKSDYCHKYLVGISKGGKGARLHCSMLKITLSGELCSVQPLILSTSCLMTQTRKILFDRRGWEYFFLTSVGNIGELKSITVEMMPLCLGEYWHIWNMVVVDVERQDCWFVDCRKCLEAPAMECVQSTFPVLRIYSMRLWALNLKNCLKEFHLWLSPFSSSVLCTPFLVCVSLTLFLFLVSAIFFSNVVVIVWTLMGARIGGEASHLFIEPFSMGLLLLFLFILLSMLQIFTWWIAFTSGSFFSKFQQICIFDDRTLNKVETKVAFAESASERGRMNVASHAAAGSDVIIGGCRRSCLKNYTPDRSRCLYVDRLDEEQLLSHTWRNTLINSLNSTRDEVPAAATTATTARSSPPPILREMVVSEATLHESIPALNLSNNAVSTCDPEVRSEPGSSRAFESLDVNLIDDSVRRVERSDPQETGEESGLEVSSDVDVVRDLLDEWRRLLEAGLGGRGDGTKRRLNELGVPDNRPEISEGEILSEVTAMMARSVDLYFLCRDKMAALLDDRNAPFREILECKRSEDETYARFLYEVSERLVSVLPPLLLISPSKENPACRSDENDPKRSESLVARRNPSGESQRGPGEERAGKYSPYETLALCLLEKAAGSALHLARYSILSWLESEDDLFAEENSWEGEYVPDFDKKVYADYASRVNAIKVKIGSFRAFDPERLFFKKRAQVVRRDVLDEAAILCFRRLSDMKTCKWTSGDGSIMQQVGLEIEEYASLAVSKLVGRLILYLRINLRKHFDRCRKEELQTGNLSSAKEKIENCLMPGLLRRCREVLKRGLTGIISNRLLLEEAILGLIYVHLLLHNGLLKIYIDLTQAEFQGREKKASADDRFSPPLGELPSDYGLGRIIKTFLSRIGGGVHTNSDAIPRLMSLGIDHLLSRGMPLKPEKNAKQEGKILKMNADELLKKVLQNVLLLKLLESGIGTGSQRLEDIHSDLSVHASLLQLNSTIRESGKDRLHVDKNSIRIGEYLAKVLASIDSRGMTNAIWSAFFGEAFNCTKRSFQRINDNVLALNLRHFERLKEILFSDDYLVDCHFPEPTARIGERRRPGKSPKYRRIFCPNLSMRGGGDCKDCDKRNRFSVHHFEVLQSLAEELEKDVLREASESLARALLRCMERVHVEHQERRMDDAVGNANGEAEENATKAISGIQTEDNNGGVSIDFSPEYSKDLLTLKAITSEHVTLVAGTADLNTNRSNNALNGKEPDDSLIYFPDSSSSSSSSFSPAISASGDETENESRCDDNDGVNFNDCNSSPGEQQQKNSRGRGKAPVGRSSRRPLFGGKGSPSRKVEAEGAGDFLPVDLSRFRGRLRSKEIDQSPPGSLLLKAQRCETAVTIETSRNTTNNEEEIPSEAVLTRESGAESASDNSSVSLLPPKLVEVQFGSSSSSKCSTPRPRSSELAELIDWSDISPIGLTHRYLTFMLGGEEKKEIKSPVSDRGESRGLRRNILTEDQIENLMKMTLMEEARKNLISATDSSCSGGLKSSDGESRPPAVGEPKEKFCDRWAVEHPREVFPSLVPKSSFSRSCSLVEEKKELMESVGMAIGRNRTYAGGSKTHKPKNPTCVTPEYLLPCFSSDEESSSKSYDEVDLKGEEVNDEGREEREEKEEEADYGRTNELVRTDEVQTDTVLPVNIPFKRDSPLEYSSHLASGEEKPTRSRLHVGIDQHPTIRIDWREPYREENQTRKASKIRFQSPEAEQTFSSVLSSNRNASVIGPDGNASCQSLYMGGEDEEEGGFEPATFGETVCSTSMKLLTLLVLLCFSCVLISSALLMGLELEVGHVHLCLVNVLISLAVHCFLLETVKVVLISSYYTCSTGRVVF